MIRWPLASSLAMACQIAKPGATLAPRENDVSRLGAKCDGVADDTTALQASLDRGSSQVVALPPGRTCLFRHLRIPAHVTLEGHGSRLKALPGDGPFIEVIGDDVTMARVVVDGNAEAGAHGWLVVWRAQNGRLADSVLENGDSSGLAVVGLEAAVVADHTTARGFRGALGVGFRVETGTLIAQHARAEHNTFAGFFFARTANAHSMLVATTAHNGIGAEIDGIEGGSIRGLISDDDDHGGLLLAHGAAGWDVANVDVVSTGHTSRDPAASGVELKGGCHGNHFLSLTTHGVPGYGLAVTDDSDENRFDTVLLDARDGWDGDPGLVLSEGSDRNRFGSVTVIDHTIGLRFGDNDLQRALPSTGNVIERLQITGAHYNAIRFEWGSDNRIDTVDIVDSDSSDSDRDGFKGVVYFGNDSSGNSIRELKTSNKTRRPNYVIFTGACSARTCQHPATSTGNRIEHAVATSWTVEAAMDTVGGNYFSVVAGD